MPGDGQQLEQVDPAEESLSLSATAKPYQVRRSLRDTAVRWALCCNFCEPCFQSYPTAVRGMLVLTVLVLVKYMVKNLPPTCLLKASERKFVKDFLGKLS